MITVISINDRTSNGLFKTKKKSEKRIENVESKIKSFAFCIESIHYAEEIVDGAERLGLTVDKKSLMSEGRGSYLTFGMDSDYDVSAIRSRKDLVKGIKVYNNYYDILDAIEKMSEKKDELTVIDALRVGTKTYRELALNAVQYKSDSNTREKLQAKKNKRREAYYNLTVGDHIIFDNHGGYCFKRPNDWIENIDLITSY